VSLAPGLRVGPFDVVSRLGAGGMGEVYRARDARLGRDVALKTLPGALVQNAESRARLEREARLLASLSHPNVASLFGIEDSDGTPVLVMELVPGPTLAERLERGPLPVREALEIARQVAEGLEAAHRKGIIHRDLKPGNVKLTPEARVKVLDFGLAKALSAAGAEDPQQTKTASGETGSGVVMGTAAYMSPEQARGEELDERTDVWSFGCLLYECLTGRRAFAGATVSDTLAAVLVHPPEWSLLPGSTPASVKTLLRLCLQKERARRLQSMGDARLQIEEAFGAPDEKAATRVAAEAVARGKRLDGRMLAAVAGALVLVALGVLVLRRPSGSPIPRVVRTLQITRDPGLEADPAISPDGKFVAYAKGPVGETKIYLQQVSGGRAVPLTVDLPGGHYRPRWSPDGSQIAFSATVEDREETNVVPALGGAPRRITAEGLEPAWSPDGEEIAYWGGAAAESLFVVPVRGGEPRRLLIERIVEGQGLTWSRRGNRLAYSKGNGNYLLWSDTMLNPAPSSLWSISANGGEPVRLTDEGHLDHSPVFEADGAHLLFVSDRGGSRDVYGIAVRPSGEPSGPPERLTTGLNVHSISLSADDKTLAYSVVSVRQNIWSLPIPAKGPVSVRAATPVTTGNQTSEGMNVSPDGRWLVFDSTRSGSQNIFKMPLPGGEPVQLTNDPAGDCCPTWSPDGARIAFYSFRTGNRDIFVMSADGGSVRQLTRHPAPDKWPTWSPDGKQIVFVSERTAPILPHGLFTVSADKGELQGEEPKPLTKEHSCCMAAWSPDGRWIAGGVGDSLALTLIAPDSGEMRTLPLVSTFPIWSSDGRTLYYMGGGGGIWKVPLSGREPELLVRFDHPEQIGWALASDGKRFYFTRTEYEGDVSVMELQ